MKHIYLLVFFCSVFALSAFTQNTWNGATKINCNLTTNGSSNGLLTGFDRIIISAVSDAPCC